MKTGKSIIGVFSIMFLFFVTACSVSSKKETELPLNATNRPSSIPTSEPVLTAEPTSEPTDAPVLTNKPIPTPTLAPTNTPVPTVTPEPTPTDKPTLEPTAAPTPTTTPVPTDTTAEDSGKKEETLERLESENVKLKIQVGDAFMFADFEDNSSAKGFQEKLAEGSVTVNMSDYGNFEKVGALGFSLPRNDEQITTEPGDIILYQGNQITIYYDTNSWNFTRMAKITGKTQNEIKAILGTGDVTVTFSLSE